MSAEGENEDSVWPAVDLSDSEDEQPTTSKVPRADPLKCDTLTEEEINGDFPPLILPNDGGSDSDDEEEMTTFLDHHRRAMSVTRARSMTRELSVGRELRASSMTRDTRLSMPRDVRASTVQPRDITGSGTRDIRSMSRDIRASVAKEFESATRDFLSTRPEDSKEPSTSVTSPTVVAKET